MRGQPDYGMYAPKEVTTAISDMGEVAARLGSIVTFDKRGDVVDFDNFEGPVIKWSVGTNIAGSYVRHNSESVRSGAQALKLNTADDLTAYAFILKRIAILASKRLGLELSFSFLTAQQNLHLSLEYAKEDIEVEGEVKIEALTHQLYVKELGGAWIEVATLEDIDIGAFSFHTVKLVVDFNTNKYVRLLFDEFEYDISGIDLFTDEDDFGWGFDTRIFLANPTATGGLVYLDDWILTQAEP